MSNTFGKLYRLTTFGESHGPAMGGIIDGCPAGIFINQEEIAQQLARRRPGQSHLTTSRNEDDKVVILSGIYNGFTTGTPLGFIIENKAQISSDYDELANIFRPGHADYTYHTKYRGFNDPRGGGRASARETVCRVFGGAIATQILRHIVPSVSITAYTKSVGTMSIPTPSAIPTIQQIDANAVRCPDGDVAIKMEEIITAARNDGDTVGGVVECIVHGCPPGLGEPVFNKLSAGLASAMMSINGAKGFELGMGFEGSQSRGSEVVDNWIPDNSDTRGISTQHNYSGGIQGGISNGEDIIFRVAFKPVATLMRDIATVDHQGNAITLHAKGRHDPCIVPRAVPVVEAMAAMTILDFVLLERAGRL